MRAHGGCPASEKEATQEGKRFIPPFDRVLANLVRHRSRCAALGAPRMLVCVRALMCVIVCVCVRRSRSVHI